jgi:hypothetical protein
MARTPIGSISADLQNDDGNVLWSFIRGEQLEYEVTLNFLSNADAGYEYEAVIMEANNIPGNATVPTDVMVGGTETTLVVRVPPERGVWDGATAYDREDVVYYGGLYYKLSAGSSRTNVTTPDADSVWVAYVPNKVFIQFPEELSITPLWLTEPTPVSPVYGFFELRVKEPTGGVYQRTWKPMRGLVQLLFSPTHQV